MGGAWATELMRGHCPRYVLVATALLVTGGCSLDFDRFRPELVPAPTPMDASAAGQDAWTSDARPDSADARAERSPASDAGAQ